MEEQIDAKVNQLFSTIGSDVVHVNLLKYGLKLIEISLSKHEEIYFLQILQSYAQYDGSAAPQNKQFVHKEWIKRFLRDKDVPQDIKSLQRQLMTNLERKSHLLLSDLSRRNSYDTVTNSDYPLSDDTFTNLQSRAHHRDILGSSYANNMGNHGGNHGVGHLNHSSSDSSSASNSSSLLARDLQQIYVSFFRETLKSRTKALGQYIKTRYAPTHKKYWRDIFLFMSEGKAFLDRDAFQKGIKHCGIKIRTGRKERRQRMTMEERQREIDSILNAVFMEMDFDHTGYITVHAFASMMMSEDQGLTSSNVSDRDHGHGQHPNRESNRNLNGHHLNGHHHNGHKGVNANDTGDRSHRVSPQRSRNRKHLSPHLSPQQTQPHHLWQSHSNQLHRNSPRRSYDHLQTSINNQRHHLHHKYGNRLHLHPQHHSYNPQRIRPVPPNSKHLNPKHPPKRKGITFDGVHDAKRYGVNGYFANGNGMEKEYARNGTHGVKEYHKGKKRKRNFDGDTRDHRDVREHREDGGDHYVVVNEYDPTPDHELRKNFKRIKEHRVARDDSISSDDTPEAVYAHHGYHDVEEKTHPHPHDHRVKNEEEYLRETWDSIHGGLRDQHHDKNHDHDHKQRHGQYVEEEQDEKIPMLDVLQNHTQNMADQETSKLKKKKKHKKNKTQKTAKTVKTVKTDKFGKAQKGKMKKKHGAKRNRKRESDPYSFLVMRQPLTRLDVVERKYILSISRERQCIVLSPSDDFRREVCCEFGFDQIINGDHQSTTIQIKTLSGKRIVYEFESSESKDEFVDLWEATNHELRQMVEAGQSPRHRSTSELLPRGVGFVEDLGRVSFQMDGDVDRNYYDDECSICRASVCTPSTFYWFFLISTVHILGIYFFIDMMTDGVSDWVLFNMLILRVSESETLRKRLVLCCVRTFDCASCHYIAYYGVSTQSLITIWTVFWLTWDTVSVGRMLWESEDNSDEMVNSDRTPLEVISFGFVVLSLTFLVFAQFAYCRCRCCSPTVSKTLHTVLARSSYFFMAFYAVLSIVDVVTDILDLIVLPTFWFSAILFLDFTFYAVSSYVLRRHILIIQGKDISLRVLSNFQCEFHIPFRIDPFSFLWISNDGASWMRVPVLATTFSTNRGRCGGSLSICQKRKRSKLNRKRSNVEQNPYHHPPIGSVDLYDGQTIEMMELDVDDDDNGKNGGKTRNQHKTKSKKTTARSKLKYEAVDSGRTGFFSDDTDHDHGLSGDDNDFDVARCSIMIHSRNKVGARIIQEASRCFEESRYPLFVKQFECPLNVMCFATSYHRIRIIATDDRVIPAISYLLYHRDRDVIGSGHHGLYHQEVELLWLANRPAAQYQNLYEMLTLLKTTSDLPSTTRNLIEIVDMKKKNSMEKQIEQFLHGVQSQAIFALTSRHQAQRIRRLSRHAAVYAQRTEWY